MILMVMSSEGCSVAVTAGTHIQGAPLIFLYGFVKCSTYGERCFHIVVLNSLVEGDNCYCLLSQSRETFLIGSVVVRRDR